jgi:hypothetical protein
MGNSLSRLYLELGVLGKGLSPSILAVNFLRYTAGDAHRYDYECCKASCILIGLRREVLVKNGETGTHIKHISGKLISLASPARTIPTAGL